MGLRKRTADAVDGSFWDTSPDAEETQDWAGYLGLDEFSGTEPTAIHDPEPPTPVQLTRSPTPELDGVDPYGALPVSIDDLLPRR